MNLGEALVSLTITLSALAGFNAVVRQHSAIEKIFKTRIERISKIKQEMETQEHLISQGKLSENCKKFDRSENCYIFECSYEDQEYSLCLP